MANIHIQRHHHLGMDGARKVAWQWAEHAESEFDMQCAYEEGVDCDEVHFSRTGAKGTLRVTADHFELDAQLGFPARRLQGPHRKRDRQKPRRAAGQKEKAGGQGGGRHQEEVSRSPRLDGARWLSSAS